MFDKSYKDKTENQQELKSTNFLFNGWIDFDEKKYVMKNDAMFKKNYEIFFRKNWLEKVFKVFNIFFLMWDTTIFYLKWSSIYLVKHIYIYIYIYIYI